MKVALVHSYYSSAQPSGENIVVDAQANALRERGLDVRVISKRTDDLDSQPAYRVRSAVNVITGVGPSPIKALRAFNPDVVHVHNLFPNWGTRWLEDWPGPIVATVHNFRPLCAAGTLYRNGEPCTLCLDGGSRSAVKNACYRSSRIATIPLAISNRRGASRDPLLERADRIIVLSPRAQAIYATGGVPIEKTVVIPNFVEDTGFRPEAPRGKEWVYIGRLSREKGIVGIVANWPKGHRLKIYGTGPLRREVASRSLSNDDIQYMGPVPRAQVPIVLSNSTGLVFPSEWAEGFPTIYVEALAAGRPVVARMGNSAADDVFRSNVGSVFDDYEQLELALSDCETRASILASAARLRYEEEFTSRTWFSSLKRTYEDAIIRRRGRS